MSSVLSNREILAQMSFGNIKIEPFDHAQLNPNSYDLRLDKTLLIYEKAYAAHRFQDDLREAYARDGGGLVTLPDKQGGPLDMRVQEPTVELIIPEEGLVLYPGVLYLGSTIEYTETRNHVPCITGRSSVARLGMSVHHEAGFGDAGFAGQWTYEITVVQPLRVYAGVRVAQIFYLPTEKGGAQYTGKYQNQRGPRASSLWKDFVAATPARMTEAGS